MHDHDPGTFDNRPPAPRPWCLFRSGHEGYAVGLESVAEVVDVERLVRLPLSPPKVLGLCTLRRELIPVIALGDGPEGLPTGGGLVLILRTTRGAWAVRINAEGTVVAEDARSEPSPSPGTVHRDGSVYAVVDPERTWDGLRRGVDDWYRAHSRAG